MNPNRKVIIRRPKLDNIPAIMEETTREIYRGWKIETDRLISKLNIFEKYDFVRRMVLLDTILTKDDREWIRFNTKLIERVYNNNDYKVPFKYQTDAGQRFVAGEEYAKEMSRLRKEHEMMCGL
jgi:hypothetical protein